MSREKGLGGKVLDKPRSLLFQDGGENLCISLEDIGAGWKCKGSYQVNPKHRNMNFMQTLQIFPSSTFPSETLGSMYNTSF